MKKDHHSHQTKMAERRWLEKKLAEAEDAWGPNSSAARKMRYKLEQLKQATQN